MEIRGIKWATGIAAFAVAAALCFTISKNVSEAVWFFGLGVITAGVLFAPITVLATGFVLSYRAGKNQQRRREMRQQPQVVVVPPTYQTPSPPPFPGFLGHGAEGAGNGSSRTIEIIGSDVD